MKIKVREKRCERLSDFSYEDVVEEVVQEMEKTFEDEEVYSKSSEYDVKMALSKALKSWVPDLLLNVAEDAMDRLGYFANDYGTAMSVIRDAVDDAR